MKERNKADRAASPATSKCSGSIPSSPTSCDSGKMNPSIILFVTSVFFLRPSRKGCGGLRHVGFLRRTLNCKSHLTPTFEFALCSFWQMDAEHVHKTLGVILGRRVFIAAVTLRNSALYLYPYRNNVGGGGKGEVMLVSLFSLFNIQNCKTNLTVTFGHELCEFGK